MVKNKESDFYHENKYKVIDFDYAFKVYKN